MKKYLGFLFAFVFILISLTQVTLGFFNKLRISYENTINIGAWEQLNNQVTPGSVLDYVRTVETIIETRPDMNTADIIDYLYELLFSEDGGGNVDYDNLNEIFADYTMDEMIETIGLIVEYCEAFLTFDDDNKPVFPPYTTVSSIDVQLGEPLLPGQYRHINKIIQLADLAAAQWWQSVTLQITIEAPEGDERNISDYTFEVLVDAGPFISEGPFQYNYLIEDRTSYEFYRAQGNVLRAENSLIPVDDGIMFNTLVYKELSGIYEPVWYRHQYPAPVFSGSWSRLPYGPNIYLGPPSDFYDTPIGVQQEIMLHSAATRPGMIAIGKANGTQVELKMDINERRSVSGGVPVIPIIIAVSRGLELDGMGNPLPDQSLLTVIPKITMRVIAAGIWAD